MPAPTPGYVKNMIRRCFREQVDKSPTRAQVARIWEYFENSCAYCGAQLNKKIRKVILITSCLHHKVGLIIYLTEF